MRRPALLVVLAACAPSPRAKPPPLAPDPSPPPVARNETTIPPLPQTRRVAVRVAFADGGLHVRVTANGDLGELAAWKMPLDTMTNVSVEDVEGVLKFFERVDGVLEVRAPRPTVAVVYDVKPEASDDDTLRTVVEQGRFRAFGERILALPIAFDAHRVEATIEIDAHAVDAPVSASSWGVGGSRIRHVVRIAGAELRRTVFFAGAGGHAIFDAPEGHDEAAWLGWTAFDPRAVSAEVAGFRGLLHDYFKAAEQEPATLLLFADERPRGRYRVMRRGGGVVVGASGKDAWDAPLRIAVGHELAHAWIGERLWVGDAGAFWFQEGFARWVSREQLARAGLLSPEELAAEVNRLLGVVTTAKAGKATVAEQVARGALFATTLDARIRARSNGARSLDDLLRALLHSNEAMRVTLSVADFLGAATNEGGEVARTDFDELVVSGRRVTLPGDSLGGCFEARTDASYAVLDAGFDVAGSRADGRVRGVDPRGAAAKAGLRDGDALVRADDPADTIEPMNVAVERDGKPLAFSYAPSGGVRRGQAFRRKPGLSDDACKKLALRK